MTIQHHIQLGPEHLEGNGGVGRYVLMPGDRTRAAKIAETYFEGTEVVSNPRGYTAHLGRLPGAKGTPAIDVVSISSGMGCPSVEIIVHELILCGANRIVRVGSCGSLVTRIRAGQVIVVTGAVRDERTTDHYVPREFPAMAHPDAVAAMSEGARRAGLASETFRGICHSKDSLYAREFGHGPAGKANKEYMEWLARAGCVASEMEAAALFVLAGTAHLPFPSIAEEPSPAVCQAVAVLAVYGDADSNMDFDEAAAKRGEQRAIAVAIDGVRAWADQDRARKA